MRHFILRSTLLSFAMIVLAAEGCATGTATLLDSSGAGGDDSSGTGGASTTTATTTATATATTGTGQGGDGPCTTAAQCAGLDDACNVGTCINGACSKSPANDHAGCDDGKFCTANDSCLDGVCSGTPNTTCSSSDTCHVGTCDPVSDACVTVPGNDGAGCVDDDPCTLSSTCSAGQCVAGLPIDCSFLNGTCSIGSCDPQLGCVAEAVNDGTPCDDGLYCTVGETCSDGVCAGQPNTCAAPGNTCMIGACDENANTCAAVPGNNGGACDDQNACTMGESCSNGVCGSGAPGNNGGSCNDGNPCTTSDKCQNGACAGAPAGCQNGDGCCPVGCAAAVDDDCLCLNVGGGALAAENGLGLNEQYCYNANDSVQTRAQKACESHFGIGSCCIITGGYQDQQYGQCNQGGFGNAIHWHWDNHPDGHCEPFYVIGQVVSPGWCGVILGSFID